MEGAGAQTSGLKTGDIITAVNEEAVTSSAELTNKVICHALGETITVTIARASEGEYIFHDIEVTLTENTDVFH